MKKLAFLSLFIWLSISLSAQTLYDTIAVVKHTSIKDQQMSGTCWSFGTISFIESELLRMGKDSYDLSEMYIVYHCWPMKSEMHVRMRGENFFTFGGQMHDVMNVVANYGLMPEKAFGGYTMGPGHDHSLLDTALIHYMRSIAQLEYPYLPADYLSHVDSIVGANLGVPDEEFSYNGHTYTAKIFRDELGFNPDDYVTITSYSHRPYYEYFVLEDKYNWASGLYFNVPPERYLQIVDSALLKGYSLVYDGDATEDGFLESKGIATIDLPDNSNLIELRQQMYNDHRTTVDHVMHVVGKLKKYTGEEYYLLKNSWGEIGKYNGYILMSSDFFFLKAVALMLHKDALPEDVRERL